MRINGKKTKQNYRTNENDVLDMDVDRAELPEKNTGETEAIKSLAQTDFFKRNLKIIFEDEGLIACNKPPNLVVHPGTGHSARDTLIDLVKSYVLNKKDPDPECEPLLVHRIDRDTSGIILVAKNKRILRFLHTHFRDHQIEKIYIAVCHGTPRKPVGTIEVNLAKILERNSGMKVTVDENGQVSKSRYSVLRSNGVFSELEVSIATGRTHQIRVHLAHIGCPIVGDVRYGNKELDQKLFANKAVFHRLYLHAHSISFMHPLDNKRLTLIAPLPEEFSSFECKIATK